MKFTPSGTFFVPDRCTLIRDWDGGVRRAAAEALGKLGDPQAVPHLIQALGDWSVREAAAEALLKIGTPAVPALSVRAHAGEDAAHNALQALGHPALDLPQAVAQVAAQGAWGVLIRALPNDKVHEAVAGLGTLAVPALIQALGDRDEDVRCAAAEALAKIGTPAVPALIQALGDSDNSVRRAACEALGAIGDPQAVPHLIQALGDSDRNVRRAACEALGTIGDPQAVPHLIQALGDNYNDVRGAAAGALGAIGDPQAVPHLIQALGDRAWWVRKAAAKALGAIGDPQAVPALIGSLRKDWYTVRCVACWALGELGDPQAVPVLIKALGDNYNDVREAAAKALCKFGDPHAVPALSVWAHAGEDAARNALQTLGHPALDLPQAVAQVAAQGAWSVLIRALPNEKVREAVVGLGTPAVPALSQALGDWNWDVRRAAAEALVKIGMPAVPALHKALTDEDQEICRRVCKVLGAIGDASSLVPLHSLRQRYPELEREIEQAIERIEAYTAWLREASAEVEDTPATDEPELPEQWLWATYDLAETAAVGEDEEPSEAWAWDIDTPTEQASAEVIDTLPKQWLWETYSLAEQATVLELDELLAWDEEEYGPDLDEEEEMMVEAEQIDMEEEWIVE